MPSLKEMAEKITRSDRTNPFAFPSLGWEIRDRQLHTRYIIASRSYYDPYTQIPWGNLDQDRFSEEEKIALRYYWSRVAIFEYQLYVAILKALEQSILQGYAPDIRNLVQMHARDEWWHTEMPAEYARRLGGVMMPPPTVKRQLEARLKYRDEIIRKDIGLFYAANAFGELVWASTHIDELRQVKDPLAQSIFVKFYTDEQRHARSNWEWASKDLTEEHRNYLESYLPYHYRELYGWLNMGYKDLSPDEKELHVECLKIARDLGVSMWDAEGYLKQYERSVRLGSKLMEDAGFSFEFPSIE